MARDGLWVAETTTPTHTMAKGLARTLVERRLAACVHVFRIESAYRWEGAVEEEDEWCVSIKTVEGRLPAVREAIAETHTYAVYAFVAWPVGEVLPAYLDWLREETQ